MHAAHDKLPFNCKLQIVDSEAEIVQNFLASSAGNPLDLANFTDDIEDDEEPEFCPESLSGNHSQGLKTYEKHR